MSRSDTAGAGDTALADPKGLVRESYAIDGITPSECRSILIDWALSLPVGADVAAAAQVLLGKYGTGRQDHPMSQLLQQAYAEGDDTAKGPAGRAGRRGGRAGRVKP